MKILSIINLKEILGKYNDGERIYINVLQIPEIEKYCISDVNFICTKINSFEDILARSFQYSFGLNGYISIYNSKNIEYQLEENNFDDFSHYWQNYQKGNHIHCRYGLLDVNSNYFEKLCWLLKEMSFHNHVYYSDIHKYMRNDETYNEISDNRIQGSMNFDFSQKDDSYSIWQERLSKFFHDRGTLSFHVDELFDKKNSFVFFYQPIQNVLNNKNEKYEMLIRYIDSNGNIIPPSVFLDYITLLNMHVPLFEYAAHTAIRKLEKGANCELSINIAPTIIDHDGYIKRDKNTRLHAHAFGAYKILEYAPNIVFEFLESAAIENYSNTYRFIKIVKSCGGKIAIDDFGSGYSNYDYILKLEPDYLKIDGSLIKSLSESNTIIRIKEKCIIYNDLIKNFPKYLEDLNEEFPIGRARDWGYCFDVSKISEEYFKQRISESNKTLVNIELEKNISIIKSIISLSKSFGIKTIAEFVGDPHTYNMLKDFGVDYVQGYYIGEPKTDLGHLTRPA